MRNKHTIGMIVLCILMLSYPALGATGSYSVSRGDSSNSDSNSSELSSSNAITDLIDPLAGLNSVLNSPAGKPIKSVLNLVVGFVMLYTLYSLIKDYIQSQSDNSEKSSSGFLNMGKHTIGLLVLLVCLGFVGVFMNYQL
ncbi:MAG: hypothetical protein PHG06_00705 [Parabacteroides sp.]|nr:hypothetical protein [Parabacteroides sp.]